MPEAYIYDHVRTPRGRGKPDGALHEVTALALATVPLRALKERNNLGEDVVDDVVLGVVDPVGEAGSDIARFAALKAGLGEAVTGVQAFRGGNDPQVMQSVLRGTYDPPSSIVKGFPNEVAAIIDRALAPEPRARFATAERMRVSIEEWLAKSGSIVTSTRGTAGGTTITRLRATPRTLMTSWLALRLDATSVAPRATARRS